MTGKRLLINCSNLRVGGGVQVATSVASEVCSGAHSALPHTILMSTEVARNFHALPTRSTSAPEIRVMDTFGLRQSRSTRRLMDSHAAVLTIFGPLYRWRPPFRSIVGFAQPWIIYPNNEFYYRMSLFQRLATRLKYKIQGLFFRRADTLIVELDHVKEGLIRELGIQPERIHVVHNCLSSIYRDETTWQAVSLPPARCDLRLGFVGRNYPHKNTAIFPEIAHALRTRHGIEAKFYVTFTDAEWEACSAQFREACVNVGPLLVMQCPTFYRSMDGVIFPSLLECFSATPLEAMAMLKPLFASNRPFNRDVCHEHAHLFDPLDPEATADQIAKVFAGDGPDSEALRAACDHALNFGSPGGRAKTYLALLRDAAEV